MYTCIYIYIYIIYTYIRIRISIIISYHIISYYCSWRWKGRDRRGGRPDVTRSETKKQRLNQVTAISYRKSWAFWDTDPEFPSARVGAARGDPAPGKLLRREFLVCGFGVHPAARLSTFSIWRNGPRGVGWRAGLFGIHGAVL